MRLTLRTLLCYMDEILEPADHADIGQKIEQSEFARELMVKTRDVTKRLRLAAPVVMGKGMGADPNTVAEYLDNTLPPERVGDFEKICLESDMHLAEAAACHQILTLVLGEPAEVDPASRERMYHIREVAARLEKEQAQAMAAPKSPEVLRAATSAPGIATATATQPKKERREREIPEVPDYLRESTRSRWKLKAFAFVLAAGIGFVAFALINPGNVLDPYFGITDDLPEHVKAQAPDEVAPPEVEGGEQFVPGASTEPSGTGAPTDSTAGGGTAPAFNPNAGGEAPPFNAGTTPPAEGGGVAPTFEAGPVPALPGENAPEPASVEPPAEAPIAELPKQGDPAAEDPAGTVAKSEIKNPNSLTPEPPADPADPNNANSGENPPEPGALPTEVASLPVNKLPNGNLQAAQVGVYASPSSIILRLDGDMGQWARLAPLTNVSSGDRLLALPTYRPTINLFNGLKLDLAGGTSVILGSPDADDVPVINVLYGRLVISGSVGKPGSQVKLQLGDKTHTITFNDANSMIAVHVRRVHVPGADPEAAPAPTVVDLYAAVGNVVWDDGTAKVEIQAPMHRREGTSGAVEPEVDAAKLPDWIEAEHAKSSDALATRELKEAMPLDRPAGLSLSELVHIRRAEVRSLAARCSVYVGQYEPFVQSLKDQGQRASWSLHIETLREAMALSPANAARIREAFERHAGKDGPALYRMLWGYSAADLKAGADRQLVDALKSPNLEFRVLGFWNLKNITGLGMNYNPEALETDRIRSIQRWEQLLAENKIRLPEDGSTPAPPKELPAGEEKPLKE